MDKIKSCWKKIPIPVAFMLCSITAILLALLFTNITMRFAQSGQAMIQEKYVEIDLDDLKPANDSEGLVEAVPGEDTEKFQLIQLPPSAFSEEISRNIVFMSIQKKWRNLLVYGFLVTCGDNILFLENSNSVSGID